MKKKIAGNTRKPRVRPPSPRLVESGRHYAREGVVAALGMLAADTRERAVLYTDPLLARVVDILEGTRAALIAGELAPLGKGATWARKQSKEPRDRPARPVDLVRELGEVDSNRRELARAGVAPAEELAFKMLRSGLVSPLAVMTSAVQAWLDAAAERGRAQDSEMRVKHMLMAAGVAENTATNWIEAAFR